METWKGHCVQPRGQESFWKWCLARVSCRKEEDLSSVGGSEMGGDRL